MEDRRIARRLITAVLIFSLALANGAWANGAYYALALAKYPAIAGSPIDSCTLCHTSPPSRNAYGAAFLANGASTAALGLLEKPNQDADGDGVPNLTEILNRTFPGNAASKPPAPAVNSATLIPLWATWKRLDTGVAPPANWKTSDFIDSAWTAGAAQLGYGNVGESTTVSFGPNASQKYATTCFRAVVIGNPAKAYSNLKLRILRNDGAVVFLNGTEILRSNMPGGAIGNATFASSSSDAWIEATVNASLFGPGENVVAVEIHGSAATGPNIGFNMLLDATTGPAKSGADNWLLWR